MKKENVALLLLLLILAGNVWHHRRLQALTSDLRVLTEDAYAFAREARWPKAEEAAETAEAHWLKASPYTHIFIRHTDVDALTAAFCDYRGALAGREAGALLASYLRLSALLSGLLRMETLSFGSVF